MEEIRNNDDKIRNDDDKTNNLLVTACMSLSEILDELKDIKRLMEVKCPT